MMLAVDPDERADAERRLPILELIEQAMRRRAEVFEMVDSSADREEAESRIREAFEVTDPHITQAVLEMQIWRWTRQERERVALEAQRLRDLLAT
jgi:DNA gyrase/topoisomerase IV subunit A